jgi:hypothetical protein
MVLHAPQSAAHVLQSSPLHKPSPQKGFCLIANPLKPDVV